MRWKGIAGLAAGVFGVLAIGAPAAQAHPCAATWSLSTATFLSANNGASSWAGSLPSMNNDADCLPVDGSKVAASVGMTGADAAADDVAEAIASFEYTPNMKA